MVDTVTTNDARKQIAGDLDTNYYIGKGMVERLFVPDSSQSSRRADTQHWVQRNNYLEILREIRAEHSLGGARHKPQSALSANY